MQGYLGIDVGSVSTNFIVLDDVNNNIKSSLYLRTNGQPIEAIQEGMDVVSNELGNGFKILGAGVTGSGRQLAGAIVGADAIKNEITAHAVAALTMVPDVRTILEIGGQDSKIILLRDGVVTDFAMNSVCAAGTGSFLDQQAARLKTPIKEFGELAIRSQSQVRIAGRCTVFAESDMIHKQQMGYSREDIIWGLCEALVRNYLNNVGKGKEILSTVVFQGGVAANKGIKQAFETVLETKVIVPEYYDVMGAIGAALLAKEEVALTGSTKFKGFDVMQETFLCKSFDCSGCSNNCEIIVISMGKEIVGRWGGRCDKWELS
ncbi:MAG: acyl-CoA dehydratase activase [Desulfitobacteriaceae bacterium]|nr:acyl-CoA dehydratase activase [Desulfitobacteriaceae bacterium]MDD4401726.1 acyl-CoA dehydratase activase [Desulfitobacteriaceae bacterium]